MANDHDAQDPHSGRENTQALAKIQHSQADDQRPEPTPEPNQAAIVADPRNRLNDRTVDPVAKERDAQAD